MERPLCIGLIWALCTGEYELSLKIAIFFELAWLDIIPAGTYIPPHLGAATFMALALTSFHGLSDNAHIALAMAAGIPMAWFGTKLEASLRSFQGLSYTRALQWSRHQGEKPFPGVLIYRSLAVSFAASWAFFFFSALVLSIVLGILLTWLAPLLFRVHISWAYLWLAATFGGLLALRVRRAYAVFFTGAVLVGLILMFSSQWLGSRITL